VVSYNITTGNKKAGFGPPFPFRAAANISLQNKVGFKRWN